MGPTIMKGRQPMELKYVLIVYNVGMVVLSGYTGFQVSGYYLKSCEKKKLLYNVMYYN